MGHKPKQHDSGHIALEEPVGQESSDNSAAQANRADAQANDAERRRQDVERAEILREREQLHDLRQSLAEQKQAHEDSQASDETHSSDEWHKLEAARLELERERAGLERERLQWEAKLAKMAELDQMRSDVAADRSRRASEPSTTNEPLEKPGYSAKRRTNSIETSEQARPAIQKPAAKAKPGQADDEESIEDYMAALLTRMRGAAAGEPVIEPTPPRTKRKSDPLPEDEVSEAPLDLDGPVIEKPVVDMPSGLTELTRRTPMMEKTDLSAMRELAMSQAMMAIDTHGKKRMTRKLTKNLWITLGWFVASIMALTFAPLGDKLLLLAIVCVIAGGLFWVSATGVAWRKLAKSKANSSVGDSKS